MPGVGSNSSFSDATGEGGRISRGLRNLNWVSFPEEQNRLLRSIQQCLSLDLES